jgi:hypothetical protein
MGTLGKKTVRHKCIAVIAALVCADVVLPASSGDVPAIKETSASIPATVHGSILTRRDSLQKEYGSIPLSFETNEGQTDSAVRFLAHGVGYTLFLTQNEVVLTLQKPDEGERIVEKMDAKTRKRFESRRFFRGSPRFRHLKNKVEVIRVAMAGGKTSRIQPLDELPNKSSYFIGSDSRKWHTAIPTYRQIKYTEVYPGIDLVFYGNQQHVEFDFVLAPGADPSLIALNVETDGRLFRSKNGNLMIRTPDNSFELRRPNMYQMHGETKEVVPGTFVLKSPHRIGFEVGKYDQRRPLIIDPELSYSTYLGGNGTDFAGGIAVDSVGNAYIIGDTTSTNFPTQNGYPASANSNGTVFITKLNPAGTSLLYSTYFGGTGGEYGTGIGLDPAGNVYATGSTTSTDFPVVNGYQTNLANSNGNAFVARFDTTQSGSASLVYSTYLGGGGNNSNSIGDQAFGVVADATGRAYVTGQTASDASTVPFPTTSTAYQSSLASPNGNAFLTVLDTTQTGGASLVYSTYLGGESTGFGDYGIAIAVDANGRAYLTGQTTSTGTSPFPTTQTAYQNSLNSLYGNIFVSEIDTTQSGSQSLVYSSYFGGSSTSIIGDSGSAIALDLAGNVYVDGDTSSFDFPITPGAFQTTNSQGGRAFIAKLNLANSGPQSLLYSTFLGGTNGDEGEVANGLAVDAKGEAFIAGSTSSTDFPTTADALQTSVTNGLWNAYLTQVNTTGTGLVYSTYIGGNCTDGFGDLGFGAAVDLQGDVFVDGSTCSTNFPTTSGAYQAALAGPQNAFVAKFSGAAVELQSVVISPQNPSIPLGSTQRFTATGVYSDNSTADLTANVTWSSSATSVVTISNDTGTQGFAVSFGTGTSTIGATIDDVTGNTGVTVLTASAPTTPNIASVSPNGGAAGTTVTVLGSGFGTTQGSGYLWLGSTIGIIGSWSDTQITATVATGSTSGTVQVVQGGARSNTFTFTVATPTISNVTPTSGLAGTQVTIAGSGFGPTQGNGQVRLGNTTGIVTAWSDSQVVATVANGAASGTVQILQNGVWSNAVSFTINTPQISNVTPSSANPGANVTIDGSGFGSTQGGGVVWLGSTFAAVVSWSNTEVIATVASNALSGIVRVQQNGLWSNSESFTVTTSSSGTPVTLTPALISMLVGDTRAIQALNGQGQSVTGLSWASSDATIVNLSADNPPILTALAVGHVTITAGNASADVTVYSGSAMPAGTIQWSATGDGSGVTGVVPAVPSASGVDVFAFQASGNVAAIRADGTTAWTANVSNGYAVPDFLGGLAYVTQGAVQTLDAMTGQPNPAHNFTNHVSTSIAVGTDGTIYAVDGDRFVAIDPTTGSAKFSIPMEDSISDQEPFCEYQVPQHSVNFPAVAQVMLAGDGYAYVVYSFTNQTSDSEIIGNCNAGFSHEDAHFRVLRVSPTGSYAEISLGDWSQDNSVRLENLFVNVPGYANPWYGTRITNIQAGSVPSLTFGSLLTNADTGVVLSWSEGTGGYCASDVNTQVSQINYQQILDGDCTTANTTNRLVVLAGSSIGSAVQTVDLLSPSLQRDDGTFVGIDGNTGNMMAFDISGSPRWSAPGYYPVIATMGGGVIAQSLDRSTVATLNADGNATGQLASLPTYSWKSAYQFDPLKSVIPDFDLASISTTYAAVPAGNLTNNGTATVHHSIGLFWCSAALSGSCQASPINEPDLGFTYAPSVFSANFNPSSLADYTGSHPDWESLVMRQATLAFKAAYANYPVIVAAFAGSQQPFNGVSGQTAVFPEHTAYINADADVLTQYPTPCGDTNPLQTPFRTSRVYYVPSMGNAQIAVGTLINNSWAPLSPPNPPAPDQTSNFLTILTSTARGIGNTAAHEIGHQFQLPDMECGTSQNPCPGTGTASNFYEYYSCSGYPPSQASSGAQSIYLSIGPPLRWTSADANSLSQKLLKK